MRAKGCLIALVVVLAVFAIVAAVFGPPFFRRAREVVAPITRLKETRQSFDEWSKTQAWREPAEPALSQEQLDRFLALRSVLGDLEAEAPDPRPEPGHEKPTLEDMQKIVGGVTGFVAARLEAYRKAGMTRGEYRYLEVLIYKRWLHGLKRSGHDPAVRSEVERQILEDAAGEKDPAVAARLRAVAKRLRGETPPAPEGIPAAVHALLLSNATRIAALGDADASFGAPD